MNIISLHLPKTAGTSFKDVLYDNYGKKLLLDYKGNDNLKKDGITTEDISKYDIVHGHLHIKKYYNENVDIITWLRNPLDRLKSYFNHRILYGDNNFQKYYEKNPKFISFLEYYDVNNELKKFIGDLDVSDFRYIGITENYTNDIKEVSKIFNWDISKIYYSNIAPKEYNFEINKSDLEYFNKKFEYEIDFYKRAMDYNFK